MDRLCAEMSRCRSSVNQGHVRKTDLRAPNHADLDCGRALRLKGRGTPVPRSGDRARDHKTRAGGRRVIHRADAGVRGDLGVRHADVMGVRAPRSRIRRIHLGGAGNPVIGRLHRHVRRKIGYTARHVQRPFTAHLIRTARYR